MAAAVYTRDGRLFATYVGQGSDENHVPTSPSAEGTSFEGGEFVVSRALLSMGVNVGTQAGPRGLVAGSCDQLNSSVVNLMAMWVHPDLRGIGAADALVSSVKTWAAEVGATQLRLNVVESNFPARRCYERTGFRATGRQGVVEKTGDVEIEMTCDASNCDK